MAGGYLRVRCRSPTVPGSPIRFRSKVRTLEANAASVEAFRDYLEQRPDLVDQVHELLAGCDLACVCEYVDDQGAGCRAMLTSPWRWLTRQLISRECRRPPAPDAPD